MKPEYWETAMRTLARRDPVLRTLIRRFPDISIASRGDAFTTLARAITGQQLSVKAAQTIWNRVVAATGGRATRVSAPLVVGADPAALRACGLSQRKADYIRDLATKFVDGQVQPRQWRRMDDEAIIAELVQIKGVGRWTAEMFLMFNLLRPDVLPVDDIGLQRAVENLYNGGEKLAVAELRRIAEPWSPWRSVATWYLWRSLQPEPVEY